MYLGAHAGVGWLLAEAGGGDRRFRSWVLLASILPDIDAVTYLLGPTMYLKYHHMLSHNLLFSLIVSGLSAYFCREYRWKAFLFTQLAFYSHYFGDYFFTRFKLYFFFPFSNVSFEFSKAFYLGHPINWVLMFTGILLLAMLAVKFKRTPVEVFSVNLDRRVIHSFASLFGARVDSA
jgi:hypothetical protein